MARIKFKHGSLGWKGYRKLIRLGKKCTCHSCAPGLWTSAPAAEPAVAPAAASAAIAEAVEDI